MEKEEQFKTEESGDEGHDGRMRERERERGTVRGYEKMEGHRRIM